MVKEIARKEVYPILTRLWWELVWQKGTPLAASSGDVKMWREVCKGMNSRYGVRKVEEVMEYVMNKGLIVETIRQVDNSDHTDDELYEMYLSDLEEHPNEERDLNEKDFIEYFKGVFRACSESKM